MLLLTHISIEPYLDEKGYWKYVFFGIPFLTLFEAALNYLGRSWFFSLTLAMTQGRMEVAEGIIFSTVQGLSMTEDDLIKD